MRVVGLDVSTYVGMARLDADDESMGKVVHFDGKKGFERLQLIAQEVARTLEIWAPDRAVIEGYAFANRNSLVTLVECGTIIRKLIHDLKIEWWEVPPSVLKKWTTGNGAAKKELMAAKVYERWGFRSPSDDIVDAYALAQMGRLGENQLAALKGVIRGK